MKYIHIIIFLMTHDLTELKEFWCIEHMKTNVFTWKKLISRLYKNIDNRNFYFWWRLANDMYVNGNKKQKKLAKKMNIKLIQKYNVDIGLGASIGPNLHICHFSGVVINDHAIIGKNFTVLQNTTIGNSGIMGKEVNITLGDDVFLGSGSIIIGGDVKIGNNVMIGALTFINVDIPDNSTVYTEKQNKIILKKV